MRERRWEGVDVLPPIAYHEGTHDSCSGFGVWWNSMVNAKDC